MKFSFRDIQSGKDTHISILLYIEKNVQIEQQIGVIESGGITDIVINNYFQNSPDYQRIQSKIHDQAEKVKALTRPGNNSTVYAIEISRLEALQKAANLFRASALRLAATFIKITTNSERLIAARSLFDRGLIAQADEILREEDLLNDQQSLLAQMEYYQKNKAYSERNG